MGKKMCPGRRDFLKAAAAGAAGVVAASGGVKRIFAASPRTAAGTAPLNKWPGRVVINFNKAACPAAVGSAPSAAEMTIIRTMVDDSIKLLTGQTDIGEAWKSIFPATGTNAISLASKIAIKIPIGCNNSLSAPHWSSVRAVIDGLKQMDFSGTRFPATNITIYEAACSNNFETAGYTSGATGNFSDINPFVYGSFGTNYTDGAENNGNPGVKQQYSTVLHDAQFLINIFSPRGHSTYAERFTLGFKNHYGTYPCVYHDNPNLSQFIRNICCTGPVYTKTALCMCSGIYGQYEGNGPGGSPQNYNRYSQSMDATSINNNPTTIIMGTDPISVEMQTIKMMRIQGQGLYTTAAMPNYLKASGGVVVSGTNWPPNPTAPNDMDNIGVIEETSMVIRRIINGIPADVKDRPLNQEKRPDAFVSASQIRGQKSTFFEFALPRSHAGGTASIGIFDLKGKRVAQLVCRVGGMLNHVSWNQSDASGGYAGRGTYLVRLTSGTVNVSSKFSIR